MNIQETNISCIFLNPFFASRHLRGADSYIVLSIEYIMDDIFLYTRSNYYSNGNFVLCIVYYLALSGKLKLSTRE